MLHFTLQSLRLEIPSKSCGIYRISNRIDGKKYIGSSVNLYHRLSTHIHKLDTNRHVNRYLQSAWNKYGKHSFCYEILEIVAPEHKCAREQFYLDSEKPEYNLSKISAGFSGIVSDETRKKLSDSAKRHWLIPGKREEMSAAKRGSVISEASRRATADSNRRRVHTTETRQKLSEYAKTRRFSEEHKRKIGESSKGRRVTEDTKQRIAESLRGRHHSEEARQKMSASLKGRQHSEEAIRKRAESNKETWAKKTPEERSDATRRSWVARRKKGQSNA